MKEFKITEEQIKENKDLTLKEYFKEVFETKLEVGKWYKFKEKPNQIAFFETNKNGAYGVTGYGIDYDNYWVEGISWTFISFPNEWELATEEEVFTALKKEAEKRYKVGQTVKSAIGNNITTIKRFNFNYNLSINNLVSDFNSIDMTSVSLFNNGKWAEIISQPDEVIELNGVKYKRID